MELLVIHNISLPPGEYGGPWIDDLFLGRLDREAHAYFREIADLEVSSHFLIRRDGELVQYVPCELRAWHAGKSSWKGRERCNDFSVGIELEGTDDRSFEDAQYEAAAGLCAAIAQRYPIRAIAGHEHVAPGRKQDPGPGFDWPRMQRSLGWNAAQLP